MLISLIHGEYDLYVFSGSLPPLTSRQFYIFFAINLVFSNTSENPETPFWQFLCKYNTQFIQPSIGAIQFKAQP